uniref:Uncharacterized protein n=1 Tax=Astatotilapia calliptera TaxID=8154 RepID=A0A3P8PPM5_ASTCA
RFSLREYHAMNETTNINFGDLKMNWRPRLQVTTVCSHYIQVRVKLISGAMLLNSAFHACDLKNRLKNFSTKKLTLERLTTQCCCKK